MKVGIIGTGSMGTNLGKIWAEQGNEIFFGSRDPIRAKNLEDVVGNNAKGGTYHEAVEFSDVLVLAVPCHQLKNRLRKWEISKEKS